MISLQIGLSALHVALGIGVVSSYVPIVRDIRRDGSLNAKYWANLSPVVQKVFMAAWPLTAVGLVWYVVQAVRRTPEGGLPTVARHGLIAGLLVASMLWSLAVYLSVHGQGGVASRVGASASLAVVAACSVSLLVLELVQRSGWQSVVPVVMFLPVALVFDGILWNVGWWRPGK